MLRSLLLQLAPEHLDQAADFCTAWMKGGSAGGVSLSAAAGQMRRAAAQALCALADVEGPKFGRRCALPRREG